MNKLSVCILFGGMSPEHEVSLRSAESVLNNLDPEKYHIFPVGITRQGVRDAIKRAEAQLMEMEDRLGLVKRFKDMQTGLEEIIECATKISTENRNTGLSREINDLSVRIKSIALSLSE